MKMWVILDNRAMHYYEYVGVCSSKEKAELAIKVSRRYDIADLVIKEVEVDEIFKDCKARLAAEIVEKAEAEDLLNQMLTIES